MLLPLALPAYDSWVRSGPVTPLLLLISAAALAGCDTRGPEGPQWQQIRSLAALDGLTPPVDRSNRHVDDPRAISLGQRFYFDTDFSGASTLVDMLGRPVNAPPGRTVRGLHVGVNCATCHDPARGGSDHSSLAQVSIGAGAYDVSSQPTTNSAFNDLFYWNGRNDSLWSQIIAVTESPVSMGGNRLRTMWRIADAYRADFEALTGPLPVSGGLAEQKARLGPDGQCLPVAGACPSESCVGTSSTACWPRFPIEGRPGRVAGCQRGMAGEPFGDAYDCMSEADRTAVDAVYVGYAKVIAAYETILISDGSPFDRWVIAREAGDADADTIISDAAQRGARLFAGDAACIECHSGPLLTDNLFHDIAVPQDGPFVPTVEQCAEGSACDCVAGRNCLPWGLFDGLRKLQTNPYRRDSRWSDDPTDDSRAQHYALDLTVDSAAALRGAWKTPGLRDVALTPPYMHTGRYRTLREVVEHYAGGGQSTGRPRDPKIVPLVLSPQDVDDLVAFMESLDGAPMPIERVTPPPLPPPSDF